MTVNRPDFNTGTAPKKRSLFASNETEYSLSLRVLPSAIQKLGSKQQREIKNALREIDDLLYTLVTSSYEQAQAEYQSASDPKPKSPKAPSHCASDPKPQAPQAETQAESETKSAKRKLSK